MAGIPGSGARSWVGLWGLLLLATSAAAIRSFSIRNDTFVKDGEPFQIISGRYRGGVGGLGGLVETTHSSGGAVG